MSDLVNLRHPNLPDDQILRVERRRSAAHVAAGWEIVELDSETAAPEPEKPTNEPTTSAPQRRSRKNSEEQ